MTTYPAHGIHLRQPHPNRWLVLSIVLVAVLVGAGAWALVDHVTSSSSKGITDAQAITFIQTGKGLPGLNVMSDSRPTMHSMAMPAFERPYAIHMYRSGPYDRRVLNLFYAAGAAATHFQPSADRHAFLAMGRPYLATQIVAGMSATHPDWITQYGVTVREVAAALVRGLFAGAS